MVEKNEEVLTCHRSDETSDDLKMAINDQQMQKSTCRMWGFVLGIYFGFLIGVGDFGFSADGGT